MSEKPTLKDLRDKFNALGQLQIEINDIEGKLKPVHDELEITKWDNSPNIGKVAETVDSEKELLLSFVEYACRQKALIQEYTKQYFPEYANQPSIGQLLNLYYNSKQ